MKKLFALIVVSLSISNSGVSLAAYSICKSGVDGKEYIMCSPESCLSGDETIGYNPGSHQSCPAGPIGGEDCGRHWTGWHGPGEGHNNPCPKGCTQGEEVGVDNRLVGIPPRIQYKEKIQCYRNP
ncbi:MAG: hypothetical protein K8F25_06365 [Fimbriimonadaceae bacterium]|nr:hypothetical protein [Alphaproteobacteria bacterium]